MSVTVSDHDITELARQLADLRREHQHLAGLSHAADRRIETLLEDLRRVRLQLGDAGFRIESLILFQLGLAAITAAIVVLHALPR